MRIEGFPAYRGALREELVGIVGSNWVSAGDADRMTYARDMSTTGILRIRRGRIEQPPDFVVWPANEDQVAALLVMAARLDVPVVPYGCGSGVCGGAVPVNNGLVIDLKRLDKLLTVEERSCTATAEAGIIGERLERSLNARGYTMGHFPSSMYCSTLGGWVVTRSAGQLSTLYGKIEDMVTGLRLLTTDGRAHDLTVGVTAVPGINAGSLIMGSEGTMGIVTRASFRIHPLPPCRRFAAAMFPDIESGLGAVRELLQGDATPAAVRLYDEFDTMLVGSRARGDGLLSAFSLEGLGGLFKPLAKQLYKKGEAALLAHPEVLGRLETLVPARCLLVLTFEGDPQITAHDLETAMTVCRRQDGEPVGPAPAEKWWNNRYHVSYNASKVYESGSFVDTMETATTWDRLVALYRGVRAALAPRFFVMAHFSHAYRTGCSIYFTVVGKGADLDDGVARHAQMWRA
ncbi:FAD-binding protein, partial [bacterium]|nr:FAD-binding protein [candidate division CSSED10-310 bacterium]